jgi:hypothetical protein
MTEKNIVYVEGINDLHVVKNLLQIYKVPDTFQVCPKGGVTKIINELDVYLDESELKRIGLIIDADDDVEARWQSLRARLTDFGYRSVPKLPEINGTIIREAGKPIFGVWIMPNNQVPGILEDFIACLIPIGDRLWPYANQVVDMIPTEDCQFTPPHRRKAHIHTWLAWQAEPGKPMGQAIMARYLNPSVQEAQIFINWLSKLFEV